jgi:hypothetical protein
MGVMTAAKLRSVCSQKRFAARRCHVMPVRFDGAASNDSPAASDRRDRRTYNEDRSEK